MSIINEALKKVQVRTKETEKKQEAAPYKQEPVPAQAPQKEKTGVLWIVFSVVLAGAAAWFFLARNPLPQNNLPPRQAVQPAPEMPAKTQVTPPAAARNAWPPVNNIPQLTLSGIVYDEERPYAIINDKAFTRGESVLGATLVEIYRDRVRLSFDGKEFEIKAKD